MRVAERSQASITMRAHTPDKRPTICLRRVSRYETSREKAPKTKSTTNANEEGERVGVLSLGAALVARGAALLVLAAPGPSSPLLLLLRLLQLAAQLLRELAESLALQSLREATVLAERLLGRERDRTPRGVVILVREAPLALGDHAVQHRLAPPAQRGAQQLRSAQQAPQEDEPQPRPGRRRAARAPAAAREARPRSLARWPRRASRGRRAAARAAAPPRRRRPRRRP
jgi:hypothetical protein